jgi:hypothetical protein
MRYGRDQKFVVLISRGVKFEIRTNLKFTIWYILFLKKYSFFSYVEFIFITSCDTTLEVDVQ